MSIHSWWLLEVLLWPFGGICFTTRGPTQDPKQSLTNELYIVAAAGLPSAREHASDGRF